MTRTIAILLALSACAPSEAITRAPDRNGPATAAAIIGGDSSVGPITRPPRRQCLGAFPHGWTPGKGVKK